VSKVAVLVLNRNMREMTEALCDSIEATCKYPHDLYVLDAASDPDEICYRGIPMLMTENKRWAWSFAHGMEEVVRNEKTLGDHIYSHFWLICNDTQLDTRGADVLTTLVESLPEDGCQIHPYQTTHPVGSPQGRSHSRPTLPRSTAEFLSVHNVAFVEFVCPLITRSFYDQCLANFGCPPVGPHFEYGWGVDYEMAYFGHQLKLKSYICDTVGITHHPGTTHLNHHKTKVEDNNQMRVLARNNMLDVLEARHGRDWGEKFANSARAAGVDPHAFLEWSAMDRALAVRGARV
jgi:hypothetical protein